MEIIFDDRQNYMKLGPEILDTIKNVIIACLEYEGYDTDYEVSLSFVDDSEIQEINREFRGIDRPTDVLSFPMMTDDDLDIEYEEYSLGDIVISLETADRQAKEYNHSITREICFLVCHSMFHLLGYDHMEEEEAKIMHAKEKSVLDSLNITRNDAYEG